MQTYIHTCSQHDMPTHVQLTGLNIGFSRRANTEGHDIYGGLQNTIYNVAVSSKASSGYKENLNNVYTFSCTVDHVLFLVVRLCVLPFSVVTLDNTSSGKGMFKNE